MVFNRKGSFFLELDGKAAETPVTVAPVAEKPAKAEKAAKTEAKVAVKSVIAYAVGFTRSLGHRRIILQSDGEPSLVA